MTGKLAMKVLTTIDELKCRGLWERTFKILQEDFGKRSCEKSIDTKTNPPTVLLSEEQARALGLLQPFIHEEPNYGKEEKI